MDERGRETDAARQLAASPLGRISRDRAASGGSGGTHRSHGNASRQRWRLHVNGLVQGVGYRQACLRQAIELGLSGWVRNREDGGVELEAEGLPAQLDALRLWCESGPPAARVSGVSVSVIATIGSDWFEVRY
jgi:acylphosphatase